MKLFLVQDGLYRSPCVSVCLLCICPRFVYLSSFQAKTTVPDSSPVSRACYVLEIIMNSKWLAPKEPPPSPNNKFPTRSPSPEQFNNAGTMNKRVQISWGSWSMQFLMLQPPPHSCIYGNNYKLGRRGMKCQKLVFLTIFSKISFLLCA